MRGKGDERGEEGRGESVVQRKRIKIVLNLFVVECLSNNILVKYLSHRFNF